MADSLARCTGLWPEEVMPGQRVRCAAPVNSQGSFAEKQKPAIGRDNITEVGNQFSLTRQIGAPAAARIGTLHSRL